MRLRSKAEGLVGQEFNEDEDFVFGLNAIAEQGARNVLITQESGCWALLREDRIVHRYRARAPSIEPVSVVGSGDVLLAAYLVARLKSEPPEDALRAAVATGTASTLEVGAGRFEQRQADRLSSAVEVTELEPVASRS